MAEEHHETVIVTVFDVESVDLDRDKVLFKQRLPIDEHGSFHYWSMDMVDYDALGRPPSFQMSISAYDAPEPVVEVVMKEVVATDVVKGLVVEAMTEVGERDS